MKRLTFLLPFFLSVACSIGGNDSPGSDAPLAQGQQVGPSTARFDKGMVTISFDDGWESQVTTALPRLQSRGWKGTFYLVPGWFGTKKDNEPFMTADEAQQLVAAGQEIGDHTVDHQTLTYLDEPSIWHEMSDCRDSLSSLLSIPSESIVSFATPHGAYNDTVISDSRKLFSSHRTGLPYLNTATTDPQLLGGFLINISNVNYPGRRPADIAALIDETREQRLWLILVYHGVIDGPLFRNTDQPVALFDQALDEIAQNGLEVVTIGEGVKKLRAH
jgi:peptidoglycan/xylan/chitin deacetylase (PgdA/CDA1 family)